MNTQTSLNLTFGLGQILQFLENNFVQPHQNIVCFGWVETRMPHGFRTRHDRDGVSSTIYGRLCSSSQPMWDVIIHPLKEPSILGGTSIWSLTLIPFRKTFQWNRTMILSILARKKPERFTDLKRVMIGKVYASIYGRFCSFQPMWDVTFNMWSVVTNGSIQM